MFSKDFLLANLRPGDILLYNSHGFFGWMIRFRTNANYTHVATYIGNGLQRESREGKGVQEIPLDIKNLVAVRRPKWDYDLASATAWFETTAKGQGYDYLGLFLSFYARMWGRHNNKMWCSEFCTRDARHSGGEPFAPEVDADSISPGKFADTPSYTTILTIKKGLMTIYGRVSQESPQTDPPNHCAGSCCKIHKEKGR